MMDWAVDTTYLINDASSDVKSVWSSKHRPGHRHHNQTVLAEVMQPPHPGLIGTCAAVACPSGSVFCCLRIRQWHRCRRLAIDSGPVPGIRAPWAGCRTLWDWPWDCPWTAWVVHQCCVYRQPTVHTAFALVFCHPPCVLHGRSIETVLSWGKPRCHWFDNVRVHWCWESFPAIWYWLFSSNISGGTDRASVYDACTESMTRSHTAKLWGRQLCRQRSWLTSGSHDHPISA